MPASPSVRVAAPPALTSLTHNWRRPSLARNVALNWTATAVTILSALVMTPIIVRALQKELYGIWSFLNGLLTYSDLLYLGLGAALVKYAAEYLARHDAEGLNRLCSVVFTIYVAIGLLSLGLSALVAPLLPSIIAHGLQPPAATAARYTCVLLGFRLLSLFVCSVFTGALVAADRTDLARIVMISFTLARVALVPIVMYASSPLVALALLVSVSAALEMVAAAWLAARVIPGLRPRFVLPHGPELRTLYGFGLQSFLVIMAVKLVSYTDQTVIGMTLGAASVALFALPLQLIEYGRVLINGIGAVLLPRLTLLQMNRDITGLGNAYVEVSRIACAVAAFVNVQLIMLGPAFLARWVGHEFADPAPVILLCLGVASVLQAVSIQAPLPFLQATRRLTFPAVVLLAEGVVNVALSLALIPRFGLNGVALGTLIPSFFISFLVIPFFVCRRLDVRLTRLLSHALLPASLVGGITLLVLAGLNAMYTSTSYHAIVAKALVAAVPAAALVRLVFARSERSALFGFTVRQPAGETALSIEE